MSTLPMVDMPLAILHFSKILVAKLDFTSDDIYAHFAYFTSRFHIYQYNTFIVAEMLIGEERCHEIS